MLMLRRAFPAQFEERSGSDAQPTFVGTVNVFGQWSDVIRERGKTFRERVLPRAFDRSLKQRAVLLLLDHNREKLLASTRTGRLRLTADEASLRAESEFVPTSYALDAQKLGVAGEIGTMSFAFAPTRSGESWADGADGVQERTLSELILDEVSILTGKHPAYPGTSAFVRSLAADAELDEWAVAEAIETLRDGERNLTADEIGILTRAIEALTDKPAEPAPDPIDYRAIHEAAIAALLERAG